MIPTWPAIHVGDLLGGDVADLAVELVALLFYAPLLVLLHEVGHALFARAGGYRLTSFGVGLGRPLWSVYLRRGVVLHVDRWVLAGGAATAIPRGPPSARRAWFHGGGLILQGFLALLLLGLPDVWLVRRIELFNALVAVTNAVPWRFGGQASDGWYLLDAATGGRRGASVIAQRRALERMGAREAAVGSPMGRVYSEVCVAWARLLAGRTEAAGTLFRDDPAETTLDPWIDGLYLYVRAEWHRLEGRPLAALRVAREGLRDLELPSEEAASLLTLTEARSLVDLGSPDGAKRALARVAGIGGTIGPQAAAVLLWASLDGAPEDLELAAWRVLRRQHEVWLDPADTVQALWEAAERLEAAGRTRAAAGARRAAAELARRTLQVVEPDDRSALESRLGPAAGLPLAGLAR